MIGFTMVLYPRPKPVQTGNMSLQARKLTRSIAALASGYLSNKAWKHASELPGVVSSVQGSTTAHACSASVLQPHWAEICTLFPARGNEHSLLHPVSLTHAWTTSPGSPLLPRFA